MGSQRDGLEAFIDEERALGFHVWVAELELLVGTAKGRQADQVAAFELLQKLLVTIDTTDVGRVREYQRRCELALVDILLKGAAAPVRRLICSCMAQLYTVGDTLPMYARVSGFVSFLGAKETKGLSEAIRVGALQCLAALCGRHGRQLASSATETLSAALKHTPRGHEAAVRTAALELVAQVVVGVGEGDRASSAVQADAVKCALRVAKEAADSSATGPRLAAAGVLRAVAKAGGAAFWSNLSWFDESVKLSSAALQDEDRASADAFAGFLGDLAAASHSQSAKDAVKALEKKASKQATLQQAITQAVGTCLVAPFVDAATHGKTRTCCALTHSWLAYLRHLQNEDAADDDGVVNLAARALEMLATVASSAPAPTAVPAEDGEPELGSFLAGGEMPHAQACVLYILRVGIIESLGETGQRSMLERLTGLLASILGGQTPMAVAAMEAVTVLLEVLGEISPEQVARIEQPVTAKLLAGSSCLRRQAAKLLAALAMAEHSSAARLLRERLVGLEDAALKAAAVCGPELSTAPSQDNHVPGTPRGLYNIEIPKLKPAMDALHGNAVGVAALLVAASQLPLGVPSQLPMQALGLAEKLTTWPMSKRDAGKAAEREAGYILLGALCASLPVEVIAEQKQRLVQLWQPALAVESVAELDLRRFLTISQAKAEVTMANELWWRAAALEALKALILSPLISVRTPESAKMQRRLATILQPSLTVVLASPVLQDPQRAKGVLGGACAMFQLRLLEVYLALPLPNAFAGEHQALSKLCAKAFRGSNAQTNSVPGVAYSAASSTLQSLLNRQDAPLGPWLAGRGVLEDALQAFAGMPGGPATSAWHLGGETLLNGEQQPFPQQRSLSAALLEDQLVLLGSLLATVSEANQLQILDVLTTAATGPPTTKRGAKESPLRRRAVITAVCCTALAGLDSLARRYRGEVESRDAVAEKAQVLAEAALAEGAATADVALLRSAAEMFALAACIGSDSNAIQLLRSLCTMMASSAASSRRACLALALGCIYRSKGGIALQGTVSQAAETLLAVAGDSPGSTRIWLLHALWLLANTAGLAFIPHVKGTLALEMELLMTEEAGAAAGLRPALARLANAMVAVLGPELTLGSSAYSKTRSLLQDLQSLLEDGGRPVEEATMAELERVLYAQMLILFAPQAAPAVAHVPLLLATLQSRQPALRKAAADTLRHIAERDPEAILPARIETTLFGALDSETDSGTVAQLKATLHTLLNAGALTRPSHYLAVCSAVILAATAVAPSRLQANGGQAEALQEDEDSEAEDESTTRQAAERRNSETTASTSGRAETSEAKAAATTRLRTRTFAARCLLGLPDLVAPDERHLNPIFAQDSKAGDWLVMQLQVLIDVAFKMATGGVEALRPFGLRLLQGIIKHFGEAPDPLLEGSRLLQQSQAQFVSALRAALSRSATPTLVAAGASLAADFVRSGLAQGDSSLLSRLMAMLTDPLEAMPQPQQELYAEWVGVQARVALLEANAICVAHLLTKHDSLDLVRQLRGAQFSKLLLEQWVALIQDWLVLASEPAEVQAAYKPRLFAAPTPSVLTAVKPFLDRAWGPAMAAACALLGDSSQDLGGEQPQAAGEVGKDDYLMLMDACYMAVCNAANKGGLPRISDHDLIIALVGLRHLLDARFLTHAFCRPELGKHVIIAVGGLTSQEKQLSEAAMLAAAGILRQVCRSASPQYLSSAGLGRAAAAAILAFLEASGAFTVAGTAHEAAVKAALEAAGCLLRGAEKALADDIRPGLVVKGLGVLKQAPQEEVMAAASRFVLQAATSASGSLSAESQQTEDREGQPPGDVSFLAYTAVGAASTLCQELPTDASAHTAESGFQRFEVALDLVLSIGKLLPASIPVPDIHPLLLELPAELPASSAAQGPERIAEATIAEGQDAGAETAEEDEWGSEDEFHAAEDSDSNVGWADAGFQAAESPHADTDLNALTASSADSPLDNGSIHEDEFAGPTEDRQNPASPHAKHNGPSNEPSGQELVRPASESSSPNGAAPPLGDEMKVDCALHHIAGRNGADELPPGSPSGPFDEGGGSENFHISELEGKEEAGSSKAVKEEDTGEAEPEVKPEQGGQTEESCLPVPEEAAIQEAEARSTCSDSGQLTSGSVAPAQEPSSELPNSEAAATEASGQGSSGPAVAETASEHEEEQSTKSCGEQQSGAGGVSEGGRSEEDDWGDEEDWGDGDFQEASDSPAVAELTGSAQPANAAERQSSEDQDADRTAEKSSDPPADASSLHQREALQNPSDAPASDVASQTEQHFQAEPDVPEDLRKARESCLHALQLCLVRSLAPAAQIRLIQAVRSLATEAGLRSADARRECMWAATCVALLAHPTASTLQREMQKAAEGELSSSQLLGASETLKLLNSSLPLFTRIGGETEGQAVVLIAQLLVVCALPSGSGEADAALRELVTKLMTILAGSRSAALFRRALAQLPPRAREQLQGVLQSRQQPAAAVSSERKPTIALKTFAAVKPLERRTSIERRLSLDSPRS